MYEDIESDFWKEHFVHMLHKNMVRTNALSLSIINAKKEFDAFENKFSSYKAEINFSTSYVTWEIFVTPSVKLRLYIQSQVKASLLQVNGGDLVKIADAKFPYNPFPEIEEFLQNKEKYLKELDQTINNSLKFSKQQKLTGEIIKALLMNKFTDTNKIWHLEFTKTDYKLIILEAGEEKIVPISFKNFKQDIELLQV